MTTPTVAVCIPTIPPRQRVLRRALHSVWAQTRTPDQIIVTVDIEASGAGPTRNRCWRSADTDYVAFLDDDDEFLPEHLDVLMQAADHTGADVLYSWFVLVGWPQATRDRPDPLAVMADGQLRHPLGVPFGPEQAAHMRRHAFIPITTLVRRSALERSGGFPTPGTPAWPRPDCEDWAGLLALLDVGARFHHVPQRTWRCYHHEGSTGGRPWQVKATPAGR